MNIEDVNNLIRNRRSIYPQFYTGEIIDDSLIENLLENANWAPNHKITQPWRFTVFTGEGLQKLGDYQANLYKELAGENFDENKFKTLATKPLQCSHVIAIGVEPQAVVPEIEEIEAVACAVQNMYLTASALGLGCYWGSGGITYNKASNAFFGLSEKGTHLGYLFLGVPKIDNPKGIRKPITEKVKWVR